MPFWTEDPVRSGLFGCDAAKGQPCDMETGAGGWGKCRRCGTVAAVAPNPKPPAHCAPAPRARCYCSPSRTVTQVLGLPFCIRCDCFIRPERP